MREVTALTAAQHGAFYWFAPKRRVANVYCTLPASVLALYLNEFEGTGDEYEVFWGPNQRETPPSVHDPVVHFDRILRVDHRTFLRSDFYNVIWRPADIYEFLRLRIPAPEPAPWLCIYRGEQEARFEPRDADMLASIAGFVAHGMARGPSDEGALADTDDRALFIVDRDGALRHASVEAQHLLIMALHPCRCANTIRGLSDRSLEISQLCRTLAATATGPIGQSPPVLRLRNPWGSSCCGPTGLGRPTERSRPVRLASRSSAGCRADQRCAGGREPPPDRARKATLPDCWRTPDRARTSQTRWECRPERSSPTRATSTPSSACTAAQDCSRRCYQSEAPSQQARAAIAPEISELHQTKIPFLLKQTSRGLTSAAASRPIRRGCARRVWSKDCFGG